MLLVMLVYIFLNPTINYEFQINKYKKLFDVRAILSKHFMTYKFVFNIKIDNNITFLILILKA